MKWFMKYRRLILVLIDMGLWTLGAAAAMFLSDAMTLWRIQVFAVVIAVHIVVYQFLSMYQVIWRYAGIRQFSKCLVSETLIYLLIDVGARLFFHWRINRFCAVAAGCAGLLVLGSRLAYLSWLSWRRGGIRPVTRGGTRTLIIGAGEAARILLEDMQRDREHLYAPVGLLDDDPAKRGRKICGVRVYGPIKEMDRYAQQLDAELMVFAIFNLSEAYKKEILNLCTATGKKLMMAPSPRELNEVGEGSSRRLRNVDINDLLGRDPVLLEQDVTEKFIQGRRVLVTGGGGSIGSELCRQIASMGPAELVVVDFYENTTYDIQQELLRQYGDKLKLCVEILSVCDQLQMDRVFRAHRPELVFHAAAHKHVPLMENALEEAVKNNIFGTLTTAQMADKYGVRRFVLISSDKAVNPTNVMGATKRCCELICQAMDRRSETEFVAVRFGNVLGSNGSVIPLFAKQISEGGPVTVTHPDIIRYFMTIPEASRLVLTAGSMAHGQEIFILDMGAPVRIVDLANNMIRLSGLEPGRDIEIRFTGLRPGEKLFEELLISEEGISQTRHEKIFVAAPIQVNEKAFWESVERLKTAVSWGNRVALLRQLHELVPTYHETPEQDKIIKIKPSSDGNGLAVEA